MFCSSCGFNTASAQDAPLEIREGSGEFINTDPSLIEGAQERVPSGPLTAQYNEAEVRTVVEDLVGVVLQLDYTIAADVQGRISLRMTDVETRAGVLQRLRSALSSINVAMIDRGDFIAFVRGGGEQVGGVAIIRPGEPVSAASNVAAIILSEVAPSVVSPLVAALHNNAQVRLTDDARSLLVLAGEPAVLSAASQSLHRLDVSFLESVSTGIYPLHHVSAQQLAGELPQLIRVPTDAFELVPIERLGLLIVFANDGDVLQRAGDWILRLDQPSAVQTSPGRYVYTVRHADAGELVASLYSVMGEGAAGRGSDPRRENDALLDSVQIGAAADQNIILVRGDDDAIEAIVEMLELLDRPRPQVLIRAIIAEVTLTADNRFGVDWAGLFDGRVQVGLSDDASGSATARFPGASIVYTNVDIDVALNMLASDTRLEVISRPSILTLHNERAELQVGDQVPVVVQSAQAVNDPAAPIVNQTTYRDTGVLLGVTPQIRAGGLVQIEITQEVSNVLATTTSGIDSPTITQRRLSSNLLVPSGETVALGGLISTRNSQSDRGVPILRRAPLVGRAFRSEGQSEDRTELVILLTPIIIMDPSALPSGELALPSALARLRDRALSLE